MAVTKPVKNFPAKTVCGRHIATQLQQAPTKLVDRGADWVPEPGKVGSPLFQPQSNVNLDKGPFENQSAGGRSCLGGGTGAGGKGV